MRELRELEPKELQAEQERRHKPSDRLRYLPFFRREHRQAAGEARRKENERVRERRRQAEQIARLRAAERVRLEHHVDGEEHAEDDEVGHQIDPETECVNLRRALLFFYFELLFIHGHDYFFHAAFSSRATSAAGRMYSVSSSNDRMITQSTAASVPPIASQIICQTSPNAARN